MSKQRASQLVEAAVWLQATGDQDGARRLFEQALKLDPDNTRAKDALARDIARQVKVPHAPTPTPAPVASIPTVAPVIAEVAPPMELDLEVDAEATPMPLSIAPPHAASPAPPPAAPPPTSHVHVSAAVSPFALSPPPPAPAPAPSPFVFPPPTAPAAMSSTAASRPPATPSVALDLDWGSSLMGGEPPPAAAPAPPAAAAPTPPPPAAAPPSFAQIAAFAHAPPAAPPPPPAPVEAAAAPKNAWDNDGRPGLDLTVTSYPPPSAGPRDVMDLLTDKPVQPTPQPFLRPNNVKQEVEALIKGARDLLELDDHSGAMDLIQKAAELSPDDPVVKRLKEKSEVVLQSMYESKLGRLDARPKVVIRPDEIIWLNLDHRAGFVLAQIDGSVTFDDLFAICGMSRLDTLRILSQLSQAGVIAVTH